MTPVTGDLNPSQRVLLGPGPSDVHPRVLRAMATPLVGHLDPDFIQIMNDVQMLLRPVFGTENELTLAVPGTGTAAMEAAISNLVEPGDSVLACIHGYFGDRLADMAGRYGAQVTRLERPWGEVFDPDEIETALEQGEFKLVTLVHAETSTGALQPAVDRVATACHQAGALLVLDCVTSLGGLPVEADAWGVDIAYSAGQKSLSAPPGLSPITVSSRARRAIEARSTPPSVFYLDLLKLAEYWGDHPKYHHTAPISTMYALREALRLAHEEGLSERYHRHARNAKRLWDGLEDLGIDLFVPEPLRVPQLTTPLVPNGVDETEVRRRLLQDFNIEIAGGFGPLAGKIWRIGLMGHSSRTENIELLLSALSHWL
jgi:alanine-glyoxylate transaminase/serine-glyoxylate transaminase/serine-pyruvate transaminase